MWFAPFIQFFTSRMGIALLAIMGVGIAIWAAIGAVRDAVEDHDAEIRQNTITEVTADLQAQAARETNVALQVLQANQAHQNELIAGLASREAGRNRSLDRISAAVQEVIIEQGGEQLASPALRQSAQLLAEEWDRLYADKVETNNEPTA